MGAAILTTDGTTYIDDAEITTDASGGAGIFSYGDGVTLERIAEYYERDVTTVSRNKRRLVLEISKML